MSRKRLLTSDELGRHGESIFRGLCSVCPELVVNKSSDNDSAGWDFTLDFRPEPPKQPDAWPRETLDTREPPISCRVQVKSIWHHRDQISLKLSTLDRLTAYPGPTFIYVLKFSEQDLTRPTSAHLIHLLHDNLGRVLLGLRRADSLNKKLTKASVNFSVARSGEALEPAGKTIRDAIVKNVEGLGGLRGYISEKARQSRTLGFDESSITGSMTFKAELNELVDGFLGLRPLDVSKFQVVIKRFGIALPQFPKPITNGVVEIKPSDPTFCKLVARPRDGSPPIIFDAEFRTPAVPGLPREHHKMLFLCRIFRLILTSDGARFETDSEVIRGEALPIDEWERYFSLLVAMSTAGVDLEVVHPAKGVVAPLGEVEPHAFEGDLTNARDAMAICKWTKEVLDYCGAELPPITWSDLASASQDIRDFLALRACGPGEGHVTIDLHGPCRIVSNGTPINYVYSFPLGPLVICYSVDSVASFTERLEKNVTSTSLRADFQSFRYARAMVDLATNYSAFRDYVRQRTNVADTIEGCSARFTEPPITRTAA